jgi:hypothetical protein
VLVPADGCVRRSRGGGFLRVLGPRA